MAPPQSQNHSAPSQSHKPPVHRQLCKKGLPKFHKKSSISARPPPQRPQPVTPAAPSLAAPGTSSPVKESPAHSSPPPTQRKGRSQVPRPYPRPNARHLAAPGPVTPAAPAPVINAAPPDPVQPPGPAPVHPPGPVTSTPPPGPLQRRTATRRPHPPEFQPSAKRTREYLPRGAKRQTSAPSPALQKKARIEVISFAARFCKT